MFVDHNPQTQLRRLGHPHAIEDHVPHTGTWGTHELETAHV
jgi:hypothetical protein